ncbi:hypothetical protein BE21_18365 [Sorangium cellulosum]|uniref:Uncharacterized protein n=1 Tax=Sorangium cellulosum TaxID=56 RepID=A0A150TXE4_SORCE|nr:hypothetical protein BE21_18365 [Sorangium cellulosum]
MGLGLHLVEHLSGRVPAPLGGAPLVIQHAVWRLERTAVPKRRQPLLETPRRARLLHLAGGADVLLEELLDTGRVSAVRGVLRLPCADHRRRG